MDRVDATLQDLKNYTHDLVVGEMNLGTLIESASRQLAEQEAKNINSDDENSDVENEIFNRNNEELDDEDFEEFNNFVNSEKSDNNGS